jgi:hypothetical protein
VVGGRSANQKVAHASIDWMVVRQSSPEMTMM